MLTEEAGKSLTINIFLWQNFYQFLNATLYTVQIREMYKILFQVCGGTKFKISYE